MKSQFAQILSFYTQWLNQILNIRLLSPFGMFRINWQTFLMIYRYNKNQFNIPFEVLCDEFNQFLFDYNDEADFYMSFIFEYEKKFSIQTIEVVLINQNSNLNLSELTNTRRILKITNP